MNPDNDPDKIIYTSPDGITVTQCKLDELNQRAADYCARNHIYPFT